MIKDNALIGKILTEIKTYRITHCVIDSYDPGDTFFSLAFKTDAQLIKIARKMGIEI